MLLSLRKEKGSEKENGITFFDASCGNTIRGERGLSLLRGKMLEDAGGTIFTGTNFEDAA